MTESARFTCDWCGAEVDTICDIDRGGQYTRLCLRCGTAPATSPCDPALIPLSVARLMLASNKEEP